MTSESVSDVEIPLEESASLESIPHESYWKLFRRFLRFGFLAWGGPVHAAPAHKSIRLLLKLEGSGYRLTVPQMLTRQSPTTSDSAGHVRQCDE